MIDPGQGSVLLDWDEPSALPKTASSATRLRNVGLVPVQPDDVRARLRHNVRARLRHARIRIHDLVALNEGDLIGADSHVRQRLIQEVFFHLVGAIEVFAQCRVRDNFSESLQYESAVGAADPLTRFGPYRASSDAASRGGVIRDEASGFDWRARIISLPERPDPK
jgi:hypothetical protein